jgi:hypothetical protein
MDDALPTFLRLARKADLDEETAFAICQLIEAVGWEINDDWNWNWLAGEKLNYRSLIDHSILETAWRLLAQKDCLNLQTMNDESKRISTIVPLEGMTNLVSLGLKNNLINDLQPLAEMANLKSLTCYSNRIVDFTPLVNLRALQTLSLAKNPIESFGVLEKLALRTLSLSVDQAARFAQSCKRLPALQILEIIEGEGEVENLADFPEMPSLKILRVRGLKNTAGIERYVSLTDLELRYGSFSRLGGVDCLKALTHLEIWTSQPLSLQPLSALYALRFLYFLGPQVDDLSALARLPVLHEIKIADSAKCNRAELATLRKWLTPWENEFKISDDGTSPSLQVEIVSQETFDLYDSKESFGIESGECEDGMLQSERLWLRNELIASIKALKLKEGDSQDFFVTNKTGFERCEAMVLYSLRAYESFREIVTAIQHVLCETRKDWIIYFQSLIFEGPDVDEAPDDLKDFIVWIYADKIVATEENGAVIRELL